MGEGNRPEAGASTVHAAERSATSPEGVPKSADDARGARGEDKEENAADERACLRPMRARAEEVAWASPTGGASSRGKADEVAEARAA